MKRKEEGITLIALVVTIIVLLILAGITLGSISNHNGIMEQSKETARNAERESIIEKIEADLYTEKTKTGNTPVKNNLKDIIEEKDYGTINDDDSFTSKVGNYKIEFNEIQGWEEITPYKKIQYIESVGKQWIDTELKFKDKYQVSIKFQFLNENPTGESWLTSDWSSSKGLLIGVYYNTFVVYAGNETVGGIKYSRDYDTEIHTAAVMKDGTFFDEQLVSKTDFSVLPNLDRNIKLFSSNHHNIYDSYFSRRIYWCKIYDLDNKLIRNYIPVLDKDNVPCLYDTVEEKYYYNQGTGEFLYGE